MDEDTYNDLQTLQRTVAKLRQIMADTRAQLDAMNAKIDDQDRQIKDLQMAARQAYFTKAA